MLRKAAIQSLAIMLGVIMLSFAIKQYNAVAISASNNDDKMYNKNIEKNMIQETPKVIEVEESDTKEDTNPSEIPYLIFTDARAGISNDILDHLGEQYLVIKKPQGEDLHIQLEDIYITKHLKLVISGFTSEIPDDGFIARVSNKELFIGEPKYLENETIEEDEDGTSSSVITRDCGNDPVNEIIITSQSDDFGYNVCEIMLQLDHVYVHILYEDDYYYYIDLKRPSEVYDKILVIDAGHGGKDPGAISRDERTYEKEINLKILTKLKEFLDQDNVKVYYTRLTDETLFLRPRFTLANEVECDFFISIHCNSSNLTGPNGTEIYYYNHENKNIRTKDMAKIFSEEISKTISLKNNGTIQMKHDDIFILYNAKVPAIIIETGYISNSNDLKYLKSQDGQGTIAKGIYNGIWRAYEELMP